jgi:hypothetical protein
MVVKLLFQNEFIPHSVLRPVCSVFQSDSSTDYDLVLRLSFPVTSCFLKALQYLLTFSFRLPITAHPSFYRPFNNVL